MLLFNRRGGFAYALFPADQECRPQSLMHIVRSGADDLFFFALREHDALRPATQLLVHTLQDVRNRITSLAQLLPIGIHVGNGLARDAGIHCGFGDGRRNRGNQPRIEWNRNDIVAAIFRARPIGCGNFIRHILTRQFRFPAWVNGCADGLLIEACAGQLDGNDPLAAMQREAIEETGYDVKAPRKVFEAYMSPGSITEKLHFFVAAYDDADRHAAGGGDEHEGEDIEVLEVPLAQAMAMIRSGEIQDGKTIMLLQHAALAGLDKL